MEFMLFENLPSIKINELLTERSKIILDLQKIEEFVKTGNECLKTLVANVSVIEKLKYQKYFLEANTKLAVLAWEKERLEIQLFTLEGQIKSYETIGNSRPPGISAQPDILPKNSSLPPSLRRSASQENGSVAPEPRVVCNNYTNIGEVIVPVFENSSSSATRWTITTRPLPSNSLGQTFYSLVITKKFPYGDTHLTAESGTVLSFFQNSPVFDPTGEIPRELATREECDLMHVFVDAYNWILERFDNLDYTTESGKKDYAHLIELNNNLINLETVEGAFVEIMKMRGVTAWWMGENLPSQKKLKASSLRKGNDLFNNDRPSKEVFEKIVNLLTGLDTLQTMDRESAEKTTKNLNHIVAHEYFNSQLKEFAGLCNKQLGLSVDYIGGRQKKNQPISFDGDGAPRAEGPVIIEGPSGTGKNELVSYYAQMTGRSEFRYTFRPESTLDNSMNVTRVSRDGLETRYTALAIGLSTPNSVVVLDEFNLASTEVQKSFNSLFDRERSVKIGEKTIKVAPGVIIVITANPLYYDSVNPLGDTVRSRIATNVMNLDFPPFKTIDSSGNQRFEVFEALEARQYISLFSNMEDGKFINMWNSYFNNINGLKTIDNEETRNALSFLKALLLLAEASREQAKVKSGHGGQALRLETPLDKRFIQGICTEYSNKLWYKNPDTLDVLSSVITVVFSSLKGMYDRGGPDWTWYDGQLNQLKIKKN